jgi:hypothetical protein
VRQSGRGRPPQCATPPRFVARRMTVVRPQARLVEETYPIGCKTMKMRFIGGQIPLKGNRLASNPGILMAQDRRGMA